MLITPLILFDYLFYAKKMEPTGGVVTTTTATNSNNKNKFIVAGLAVAIIILIGAIFLFGRQEGPAGPAPTPTPPFAIPTIDQVLEAARPKVNIELTASGFVPKTATAKRGSRIFWLNKSGADGSVNSADHPTHQLFPQLNLGKFPDGFSVQTVLENSGAYRYHNHLNPEQTGTIIVE